MRDAWIGPSIPVNVPDTTPTQTAPKPPAAKRAAKATAAPAGPLASAPGRDGVHYGPGDTVAYAIKPTIPLGRVTEIQKAPFSMPNGQEVYLAVILYGGTGPEEAIITTKLVKWKG